MEFYFAPMEGVTGYLFRNTHHEYFPEGIDRYYAPFVSPGPELNFSLKKLKDLDPVHNQTLTLIPQIMTNQPDILLYALKRFSEFGYHHINLNLGCPVGTVVSKGRGSGLLQNPEALDAFLRECYRQLPTGITFSIKTRIGFADTGEWDRLLSVYASYPIDELIIHPRLREDYYKNQVHLEAFSKAVACYEQAGQPTKLIYNGDIFTKTHYDRFMDEFGQVSFVTGLMCGRGLIANPALIREIVTGQRLCLKEFRIFHDALYQANKASLPTEKPLLFRMKELWSYWAFLFDESEQILKKIRKCQRAMEYEICVREIFFRPIHPDTLMIR